MILHEKKKRAGPTRQVNKKQFLSYLLSCQSFAKAARRFNISRQRAQQIGKELGLEFKIGITPRLAGDRDQVPPIQPPERSQRRWVEHLAAVMDALFRGADHKTMCDAVALFLRARAKDHQGTIYRRMRKMAGGISDLGLYQVSTVVQSCPRVYLEDDRPRQPIEGVSFPSSDPGEDSGS